MSLRTILILAAALALPAHAAQTVKLSSLEVSKTRQGWGKAAVDLSVTGKPMSIAGQRFDNGLGTHADSSLWIALGSGSDRFLAAVGVDDAANREVASLEFKVIGDGRVLWQSGLIKGGQPAKLADIDVSGVQTLLLLVGSGGNGIDHDHANWAGARFLVSGALPKAIDPPREEAVILTPKPPKTPRINGPKVFGVRPGSAFLFTIPATGDRPMRFDVANLPSGLQVDPANGQITGTLRERGEHRVVFKVSNALGTAERPFKIVCGDQLALTPHMGWNSWYIWENHVTDQIMRDAADAMVSSGMINYGYSYVNIDDCWSVKPGAKDETLVGDPRDNQGKVNSNKRFPNMKALTDYIHAKGLKAGIYTSPGPLTCAGHVGAYQHEERDVQRFAEWGFDFLKHDWCSYGRIAKDQSLGELQKPYRLISSLLKAQPRDIILNLCQYGMGNVWEWGGEVGGNSWRTAGDLGGSFEGIGAALFRDGFDVYSRNQLHRFARPGAWNDPDYLLLGYLSNWRGETAPTPLTPNEQYTHVTLWCLVAAPLIFSGDMTRLDEFTLNLLCNDEVIAVDQDPLGLPGKRVRKDGDMEVWAKDMEDGSKAVGLFNRGEFEADVQVRWSDLGIQGRQSVRDLWRQKDLGSADGQFSLRVPRHGAQMISLRSR